MNKITKNKIKHKLSFVLLGVVLLAALSGCRSDLSLQQPDGSLRSDIRCIGSALSVAPTEAALRTKSSFTGDETTVSNWTLLQFDAASGLLAAAYYQPSAADLHDIEVVTGRAYDWYAIANVGDVRSQFTVGASTASAMAAWFATGFDMRSASALPMAWKGVGITFSTPDLAAGRKLEISLTRLVACYGIKVDKSALHKYAFQVSGATIEGPASVRPFSESKGTDVATTTDAASPADVSRLNSGDPACFFAAENCYGELPIDDPDSKKPACLGDGDHPTFVEINGMATLLDGSGLTFPARYRFYLGTNATSNFDVIRNTENTVTLLLSDAKLDAARDERDAIDAGQEPSDPLWKVEVDPYDDSRSLQFRHGLAVGGTGIRLSTGGCTGEDVTRFPSGLSYQFRLDQALYDAGIRVYLDEAATQSLLPASGYAEATWVTAEESPGTLYFQMPAGASPVEGQAHIRTLDGRKSDDLPLSGGRMLDHLTLDPAKTYILAPGQYPSYKLYAHFTDGSSEDITEDALVSWTGNRHVRYRDSYNEGREFWMNPRAGEYTYVDGKRSFQWFRQNINSSYYAAPYNTYPEVTASAPQALFTASWTSNGVSQSVDELGVITKEAASLAVSPESVSVLAGQTVSLTATVTYTDGSRENVTASAVWNNDAKGCLTNVGGGRYTGLAVGTATVTAAYGGLTSNAASVTVQARTVSSVQLQVRNPATGQWGTGEQTVSLGSDQQWRLSVRYADSATPETVTSGFELVLTTDNGAVSIRSDRITTHADAIGTDTFKASFNGVTSANSVKLTVQNHNYTYRLLVSTRSSGTYEQILADASSAADLAWNESQVFYAWYVRLDNGVFDRMEDISSSASWDPEAALVAANVGSWNGSLQQYVANNTSGATVNANLEATYEGYSSRKTVSVGYYIEPQYRLVVTLADSQIDIDGTTQATATRYTSTDGGSHWDGGVDVTSSASFSSGATGVATVASGGTVTGVAAGTATISATYDGLSSENDPQVTVTGYRVGGTYYHFKGLEVRPSTASIAYDSSEDFDLYCLYETAVRTAGAFGAWTDGAVEITNATWSQSPGTYSSIAASTGVLTNANGSGSEQTVTVTADAGASRGWWIYTTDGATPADNLTASGAATLLPQGVTHTFKLVISASPTSLETGGSTALTATLYDSTDGGSTWAAGTDVTRETTFSKQSGTAAVVILGNGTATVTATGTTAGTAVFTGTYSGVAVSQTEDSGTVTWAAAAVPALSVSPASLSWEWNTSGSGDGKSLVVTAADCEIASVGVTSGFSYSRSGNTITVWPDAQNDSTTADKTGTLTVSGTGGATDVSVSLAQTKKPAPTLTGLTFDQSHYDLVRVSGGEVYTVQAFTLTAHYSDGSSVDVTAAASYADQGAVAVDAASGTLTATAACSEMTLTGHYGGLTASATYSAIDLEIPYDLEMKHFESQEDQNREFLISDFEATLRKVLSGTTRKDTVTDQVQVEVVDGDIVRDTTGSFTFHFTAAGSGSIRFTYIMNGVSLVRILSVTCASNHHISHTWL